MILLAPYGSACPRPQGTVLRNLSADPPARAARVLSRLSRAALHPASGVPPKLRAALLTDAAIDQLVTLSAGSFREGSAAAQAADTALEILEGLATDPGFGLVPSADRAGAGAGAGGAAEEGTEANGRGAAAASARVVRLLRQLQAASEPRHARLLVHACRRERASPPAHPTCFASYLFMPAFLCHVSSRLPLTRRSALHQCIPLSPGCALAWPRPTWTRCPSLWTPVPHPAGSPPWLSSPSSSRRRLGCPRLGHPQRTHLSSVRSAGLLPWFHNQHRHHQAPNQPPADASANASAYASYTTAVLNCCRVRRCPPPCRPPHSASSRRQAPPVPGPAASERHRPVRCLLHLPLVDRSLLCSVRKAHRPLISV